VAIQLRKLSIKVVISRMKCLSDITLEWLGQSGFLLHSGETEIACDLYLSDFCRKKSKLDHMRLTPIPVVPEKLGFIDNYLITHGHIDHFDPETVGPILLANANTKFWCPPACLSVIEEYFQGDKARFYLINSGIKLFLAENVKLITIPAAHEELEKDANNEYIYFSYLVLFECEKKAVFFAGDTIPYPGHTEIIKKHIPRDYELTMILPVNGRNKNRTDLGFKGNLNIAEAIALANDCNAACLVPCHYGMFALNDIPVNIEPAIFKDFKGKTIIPEINTKVIL